MRLLTCLADHAGEIVSIDDLLNEVWPGVFVSPDSVYQAVASLRRQLGDNSKEPTYIETIPRLGYRLVAKVSACEDQPSSQSGSSHVSEGEEEPTHAIAQMLGAPKKSRLRLRETLAWVTVAMLCFALVVAFVIHGRRGNSERPNLPSTIPTPQQSIAVLPFLDLTEKMNEEPFADGMTEELIDKLSHVPGLRVPSATSSFYFKGKQIPVADIAKSLGVAYILDGSVRKSGAMLRVAARLVRADNGYVVWSETYDRPFDDALMVQDDIAGEVAKALKTSIESKPAH